MDPTGTRTEQYFALLRSSEVNSEVRQSGTGEGFGNLYPWISIIRVRYEKTSQEVPVSYVLRVIHSNSRAVDVTITVNGRVVAKPCTIQTKEANVNLGDLYTRNLQQHGSASGWHNITLSLTDCPVETSAVTAIVTGSTDNTGYYKNEGTAENIQIELRDDQMRR